MSEERSGGEHRDNVPRSKTLPDQPKSIDKPEAGTRLSAAEIHDNILGPAEDEMERAASALWWSALASGMTIGFSFLLGGYMQTLVEERFAHFVAGAAYPIGFLFVIFARSELFTENTLEPVIPLLHNRDLKTLKKLLRLWGLLLVGNLVGAALFAWVMYHSPLISEPTVQQKMLSIAERSTSDGFSLTLGRGIMAGWLIALLAWLLASTQESVAHAILIWLTTAPIAWLDFRHSIVGSVEAFYRVAAGSATLSTMAGQFIAPAVIGNAIGGVVLVALLNYGQVHHERSSG
jgi:formate/nitrite transporter FocA (FNT family)